MDGQTFLRTSRVSTDTKGSRRMLNASFSLLEARSEVVVTICVMVKIVAFSDVVATGDLRIWDRLQRVSTTSN